MPIDTQRAWLTQQAYDRARIELAELLVERATGCTENVPTGSVARSGSGTCRNSSAPGDRREFRLPSGDPVIVTLVSAVPYQHRH